MCGQVSLCKAKAAFAASSGAQILTDLLVNSAAQASYTAHTSHAQAASEASVLRPYQMVGLTAAGSEGLYAPILRCLLQTTLSTHGSKHDLAYFRANGF